MKINKIFTSIVAVFIICISPAYSQNLGKDFKDKSPEERAQFQTDLMKSKLNLNVDQQKKVESINLSYAKKFQPIIKSNDSKFTRLRQAMSLQEAKDAELEKIFSAEQYKQYEKIEGELKDKLKGKM